MILKDLVINLPPPLGYLRSILDSMRFGMNQKDFEYFMIWNQHDAIHYLCELGFSRDEELVVAKIEDVLECGFGKWRSDTFKESLMVVEYKIPDWLTYPMITEVADKIREIHYEKT